MSFQRSAFSRLALFILLACITLPSVFAQRRYTETDTYRTRSVSERVFIPRKATQATKGVLGVVLNPVIAGKVSITDAKGRVETKEADATGKAVFELRRGQTYDVKVEFPGFTGAESEIRISKPTQNLPLELTPQYVQILLPGLPKDASVLIDNKLAATADAAGFVTLTTVEPGQRNFLIRHAEYNDYAFTLSDLKAGKTIEFAPLTSLLVKVARLTFQTLPNATVLVDGELQGRVNANGKVTINYDLPQSGEHTLRLELLGYEPWEQKVALTPGPRTIEVKLTPLVSSAGVTDIFDNLNLWAAPAEWSSVKNGAQSRLQVSGKALGLLKNTLYRNFEAVFTVWLADGKGASWAVRADKEGKRYYLFHLAGANPANGLTPRRFYTYLVEDGNITEVVTPITVLAALKPQESYTIRIQAEDYVIRHYITSNNLTSTDLGKEEELGIFTDTSTSKERSLYGRFGFLSAKGEVFQVENFNIEPKP